MSADTPRLTLRPAAEAEADLVADIVYGDPQQVTTSVGLALLGLSDSPRTRRFYRSLWRALGHWRRTRLVEEDGRAVGLLQIRSDEGGGAELGLGLILRAAWILGPWIVPRLLSRAPLFERAGTQRPEGSYHIDEIHVAVSERGRGVGAALLAIAESEARERGATQMSLQVLMTNPARALYERDGFAIAGEATNEVFERYTGCPGNYLMVKPLS